ncbi:UPF0149 family protein [Arenicellales bacterium nBUS_45]
MANSPTIPLNDTVYQHFKSLLTENLPEYSASEVHGVITGLACAGITDDQFSDWGPVLLDSDHHNDAGDTLPDALMGLMALTEKSLKAQDFSFRVLLPPDTDPISERTQAVAEWCYGFGLGINWTRTVNADSLEEDAKDAIADIAELANVDSTSTSPDDENSLMEVEEYLRVATQLIFESVGYTAPTLKDHMSQ